MSIKCSKCGKELKAFSPNDNVTVASPNELKGKALICGDCGKISCSACLVTIPPGYKGCPTCKSMIMQPYG